MQQPKKIKAKEPVSMFYTEAKAAAEMKKTARTTRIKRGV